MSRQKRYIDVDVVTEAERRIRHIFDIFDAVVVMFSGGKDSLAALHLTWKVARELGFKAIDVVFRDEELIPDDVIEFVDRYRREPWVRMHWYAVPMESVKYVMGVAHTYVQWDPNRRHIRPKPDFAIVQQDGDARVYDQYSMDAVVARQFRGKVAFITGIRASESIIRYRASVNKLNENYITTPTTYGHAAAPKNVMLCKPPFDWEQDDVFKYFMDNGIEYCSIYDAQLWSGAGLRVSTPLHAEAAKRFHMLKLFAPTLYAQVIDIFPEMLVQERYFPEMDKGVLIERYGESFDGVRAFILENIDDEAQQQLALRRLASVKVRAGRYPRAYPPQHVLKQIMNGAYKREILPLGNK